MTVARETPAGDRLVGSRPLTDLELDGMRRELRSAAVGALVAPSVPLALSLYLFSLAASLGSINTLMLALVALIVAGGLARPFILSGRELKGAIDGGTADLWETTVTSKVGQASSLGKALFPWEKTLEVPPEVWGRAQVGARIIYSTTEPNRRPLKFERLL
jgi:hypothetical protein